MIIPYKKYKFNLKNINIKKILKQKDCDKDELKQFREKIGVTQKELSVMIDVSERTVESWEQGGRKLTAMRMLFIKLVVDLHCLENTKDDSKI